MSSASLDSAHDVDGASAEADCRYQGIAQDWGMIESLTKRIQADGDLLRPALLAKEMETSNQACIARNHDVLQPPCVRYGHLVMFMYFVCGSVSKRLEYTPFYSLQPPPHSHLILTLCWLDNRLGHRTKTNFRCEIILGSLHAR
jgi:hypothetical protein